MCIPLTMRRNSLLISLLVTLASMVITAAAPFPESIQLPAGFRPEGIASGDGHTFFVGSLADGAIYRIDLITGEGTIVIAGQPGHVSVGLKYDPRSLFLFVAGGPTGKAFIYDTATGTTLPGIPEIQLTTAQPTFINDVVITQDAAYFTDSMRPVLYKVPLGTEGELLSTTSQEIPLGGEFEFIGEGAFNANGIDAVPNGSLLIIVNSTTADLYTVAPTTGFATRIDDPDDNPVLVPNGDGILLQGKTLYVVQNRLNQIAVIELGNDFSSGEIVDVITSPSFDVPTTIAAFGNALYAVNARFTTPPTPTTDYNVVRVPEA